MSTWINFRALKARVSLEMVLTAYYGLQNLKRRGNRLAGPCPIHCGDNPRAFHANLSENVWHCFTGCQRGGDQLTLVALRENLSVREAALRLQRFFGGDDEARPPPPMTVEQSRPSSFPRTNPSLSFRLSLNQTHPALNDRHLSAKTIAHFGVGYASRGIMRGCLAIPIHNQEGHLVAYAGRRLEQDAIARYGKYRFPSGFRKEQVVYHLHHAQQYAAKHGLIITEGFFGVMDLYQRGFPHAVAVMGASISAHQVERIHSMRPKQILLLFDGDKAGRRGARAAYLRLTSIAPTTIHQMPDGHGPEDVPSDEIHSFFSNP